MKSAFKSTVYFNDFSVDPVRRVLEKDGKIIHLNSKTFDLLLVLIENTGEIIEKNELLDKVWADQFVEENNLTVQITALRKALGDKKGNHRHIITVPGRGYSFVAEIKSDAAKEFFAQTAELEIANHKDQRSKIKDQNPTNLIGRGREVTEIENLLCDSENRLITLTGAGGSGKTSLAQTVANVAMRDFPDGVFFIELASVSDSALVPTAIADALGLLKSDGKPPDETLKTFFLEKRSLLVLDNFEQVLSAAPFVKELLSSTSFLKILITSRRTLGIKEECEFDVVPLAFPTNQENLSIDELMSFSAISLFVRRAQEVMRTFVLSEQNASAVAGICCKLDGLPLAIELAAARVKLLSAQEILTRLEHSLKLLTGGKQDLPVRQQTMRETVSWSYELLVEDEQLLFKRLAVFEDGFKVTAAETICGDVVFEFEKSRILDLLTSLIDNNLLTVKEQNDGSMRLRMLEVVREFALECLDESGEIEITKQTHARYFLELAEEAEPHLSGEKSAEWLRKAESEHNNFRAALRWSLKSEPETAARTAAALRYFWLDHSHLTEACDWIEQILESLDNQPSTVRFKLLNGLGLFSKNLGDFEKARKSYEKSCAESKKINDLEHFAVSVYGLATIAIIQADFAAAQKFNEQALEVFREIKHETGISSTLGALGDLALAKGDLSASRPLIEESLILSRKTNNQHVTCINLINLGAITYGEKNYSESRRHFTDALSLAVEADNKNLISLILDGFAALVAICGKSEQAAQLASAAKYLRELIGIKLELTERLFRDAYLPLIRQSLSKNSYSDALTKGRSLKLSEAIALSETAFSDKDVSESEIIIETHKLERIIIEEIELDSVLKTELPHPNT